MELAEEFWARAKMMPSLNPAPIAPAKTSVHLRVDSDVLEWFRSRGKGHLSRMNAVLRAFYEAERDKS